MGGSNPLESILPAPPSNRGWKNGEKRMKESVEQNAWGDQVNCPKCGFEYVHFIEPVFIKTDSYSAWAGRGSAVRIPMYCENGHSWEVRYGFHKGCTFVGIENIRDEYSKFL